MRRPNTSCYKFQFFIMDVTIPEHYEATHCYVSLVSDQFEEIYSRKSKVVDEFAEIETTLRPKMILCLNRRSSEYIPPFAKLQVYVYSNDNPNSHSVIGSLTFDLLEQLINPNLKQIREQLAGTDVRIRLSIISYPCQQQFIQNKIFTKSVLKQISNIEQSTQQRAFPDFLKPKHKTQFQRQPEDLNFSQIMPGDVSSKLNDSSFEYNRYKDLYLEVVRLNEQIMKFKEQNRHVLAENEQLKLINAQLDQINIRLSNDLSEADEKLIRLERHLNVYQQKANSLDTMKLQLQCKSETEKKNCIEIQLRNEEMMKFINELHANQLALNHTIAEKECEIQQLQRRLKENEDNTASIDMIQSSVVVFNKALGEWRRSSVESSHQKQLQGLISTLRVKSIQNDRSVDIIVEELQKISIQLMQLKKQYLFKSEISIINLISGKIEGILNSI